MLRGELFEKTQNIGKGALMTQYIVLSPLIQCFNTVVKGSVLVLMSSLQRDVCP